MSAVVPKSRNLVHNNMESSNMDLQCPGLRNLHDVSKRAIFLGEFAKLLRAIMSIVMSVCPSVRMETLDSHWTDFHDVLYWNIFFFRKSIERTRFVTVGYE